MSERFNKAPGSCLQHVVGKDGKRCRNCNENAATIEEQNRWRASSYRVPGSWPRKTIRVDGRCSWIALDGQPIPLFEGWIEVAW